MQATSLSSPFPDSMADAPRFAGIPRVRPQPHDIATDPEAFVRRFQASIWRYLRLLGAQPTDAEDLTQETFLRFLAEHPPSLDAAPLLRTMARGLWVDQQRWYRRRRTRDSAERIEELIGDAAADLTGDRWLDALARCRQTLSDRARLALDLFYRDRGGRVAVAERLELTEHGARNLLARTRQALRDCIEQRLTMEDDR